MPDARPCDPCSADCSPRTEDGCDRLWPILDLVKRCLCAHLVDSIAGAPCRCLITFGTSPVMDDCCSGIAWVRLVSVVPSDNGRTARTAPERCASNTMAATIEIGVGRCAPSPVDQAQLAPTIEEMERTARIVASDRVHMLRAIRACVGPTLNVCQGLAIGQWSPLADLGGCTGGSMQFTVPFSEYNPSECDCPEFEQLEY